MDRNGINVTWPEVPRLERNVENVNAAAGLEGAGLAGQPDGIDATVAIAVSLKLKNQNFVSFF